MNCYKYLDDRDFILVAQHGKHYNKKQRHSRLLEGKRNKRFSKHLL